MLKKVLLIILILIVKINTHALEIGGAKYSTEFDFSGYGFSYKRETNTLELNNYNGSLIKESNNLNIVLLNNNKIKTDKSSAIEVKNLNISGPGMLEINSDNYGITSNGLTMSNVTITGKSNLHFINCKYYDLNFDNVNIKSEGNDNFMYVKGNATINNSKFDVNFKSGFISNDASTIKFRNSTLNIKTSSYVFNNNTNIVLEKTLATLKSSSNIILNKKLNVSSDYSMLVSNDDIKYVNDLEYINYKYMKIIPTTTIIEENDNLDSKDNKDSINENSDIKNNDNLENKSQLITENVDQNKEKVEVVKKSNPKKQVEETETKTETTILSDKINTISKTNTIAKYEKTDINNNIYYYIASFMVLGLIILFIIKLVKRKQQDD